MSEIMRYHVCIVCGEFSRICAPDRIAMPFLGCTAGR